MYAHTPTQTNYHNLKKIITSDGSGDKEVQSEKGMNTQCSQQSQALFLRHPKGRKQKDWTVRSNTVGFKLTFILTHSHNCPISEMT